MEIEVDRGWLLRASLLLVVPLLALVYVVGVMHTPYDAEGRAVLLSREMLVARRFLGEAQDVVEEMRAVAADLEEMAVPPDELAPPHPQATPVVRPLGRADTLLERTQAAGMALRRIRDLSRRLEETPAPEALAAVKQRLLVAAQALARWGTATADYLALPSPERWQALQTAREEALRALDEAEGILR